MLYKNNNKSLRTTCVPSLLGGKLRLDGTLVSRKLSMGATIDLFVLVVPVVV
jgi:hypothetical protein